MFGLVLAAIDCELLVLQRFQWVGVILTTDSTDGHRYEPFSIWVRSHLCPSVVKTGLSFDMITP
jgi:hypothetical protein